MLIGEIEGKTGTKHFKFKAYKDIKKMDFVAVKDEEGRWILCQVDSVESYPDGKYLCSVNVIGSRENGILSSLKKPIKPKSLIYTADNKLIQDTLNLSREGLYIGKLDANGTTDVFIDEKKLVSKHLAVLASTGAGKSYFTAVVVEELLQKKLPVVIVDPHGEYTSLASPNENENELQKMDLFDIKPKAFKIAEYSPDAKVNPGAEQLSFNDKNLTALEITQIMPSKSTSSQMGLLYTTLHELEQQGNYSLTDVINRIQKFNNPAKWNVINMLEFVRNLGIFSENPTQIKELVKAGQAAIINLRGVPPEIQNIVVYKLMKDLFELRKVGRIPSLFVVLEEAHNFCPEKEVIASSKMIRTVASEGRKFGMGLCVISQRPARVDKNVLSQCNTQFILRIMNPNDLKAVSYAEGFTMEVEREIKNLQPGAALILGLELPLFINVRVRMSNHGGAAVAITDQPKTGERILTFKTISRDNLETKFGKLKTIYYPCWLVSNDKNYLFDAMRGNILYKDKNAIKEQNLNLNEEQKKIIQALDKKLNKDNLLDKTSLNYAAMNNALESLVGKGLVLEEKANNILFYSRNVNFAPKPFDSSPEFASIEGDVLKHQISEQQISEKAKALIDNIKKIRLVYYTYYIGDKFMVDATTGIKKEM